MTQIIEVPGSIEGKKIQIKGLKITTVEQQVIQDKT